MCWEQGLQKQEDLWLFTAQCGKLANNHQTIRQVLLPEHRIPVECALRRGLSPSLGQEGRVWEGFLE